MKTIKFLTLLFLSVLLISCEKDPDEITVTINQSGTVGLKIVDSNNKVIEGAQVEISNGNYVIFSATTDASGIVNTEKLLQGYYYCQVTANKNKVEYIDQRVIQVIAGEHKTIEINPFTNLGTISLIFTKYYGSFSLPGLNVALVPYRYDENYNSINDIVSAAHFTGNIDSNSRLQFTEVPASIEYKIYVYDDTKIYYTYGSYVYTYKNTNREYQVEVAL